MLQGRGLVAVRAAMFDNLNRGLEKAWDLVRKDGKLTKDNIKGPMREIRRALLEADVRLLPFLSQHARHIPAFCMHLCCSTY